MLDVDEMVALVDEHDMVVGSAPRSEMRAKGLRHRATYVLVLNARGDLYVQKRSATKDIFPGYYEPTAGGVVLAGEDYDQGARREVEEELGIRDTPLTPVFRFSHQSGNNRVCGAAYSCVYDGPLVLQEEEIESGAFMSPSATLRLAATRPFTPDGLYVLQRYLAEFVPTGAQPAHEGRHAHDHTRTLLR